MHAHNVVLGKLLGIIRFLREVEILNVEEWVFQEVNGQGSLSLFGICCIVLINLVGYLENFQSVFIIAKQHDIENTGESVSIYIVNLPASSKLTDSSDWRLLQKLINKFHIFSAWNDTKEHYDCAKELSYLRIVCVLILIKFAGLVLVTFRNNLYVCITFQKDFWEALNQPFVHENLKNVF